MIYSSAFTFLNATEAGKENSGIELVTFLNFFLFYFDERSPTVHTFFKLIN